MYLLLYQLRKVKEFSASMVDISGMTLMELNVILILKIDFVPKNFQ
jgi:hypothetical protein